jgi:hypothetical protein
MDPRRIYPLRCRYQVVGKFQVGIFTFFLLALRKRVMTATTKPESTTANQLKEERKVTPVTASVTKKAQEEIKTLKAELAQEKKRSVPQASASSKSHCIRIRIEYFVMWSEARSAVPQPHKVAGASLANPNKRARKIQAIEFESDDE